MNFIKQIGLPTYNKMHDFYYYDVIQGLSQKVYVKNEIKKKMNE